MKNTMVDVGDRIMCLHMDSETSVPPGTLGTVTKVSADPTVEDAFMVSVNWDNGSTLSLLSDADVWKKVKKQIDEDRGRASFFERNEPLWDFFERKWFNKFLTVMRDSGIVNMFGASPLIYAGREHLDRYYGEGREEDEVFQELLGMADTARDKLIQGILKYMTANSIEIDDDMGNFNAYARKFSQALLTNYILFNNFNR